MWSAKRGAVGKSAGVALRYASSRLLSSGRSHHLGGSLFLTQQPSTLTPVVSRAESRELIVEGDLPSSCQRFTHSCTTKIVISLNSNALSCAICIPRPRARRDTRAVPRRHRSHRQHALLSGDLPGPNGSDRPERRGRRELALARWGMLGPAQYGGLPVTNIRNVSSPHWRGWLSPKNRCVVPATAFCEYADGKLRKIPTWFAMAEDRPLFAFAGL
jgi:hypothetical protein